MLRLFGRPEYDTQQVTSLGQLLQFNKDLASIDTIVTPLRLYDGSSGINVCLELRALQTLSTVPILGLSPSREKTMVQAFYEAGSDRVLCAPFDQDLVYYQITALRRQKLSIEARLRWQAENSAISRSLKSAFNGIEEGLIIFNSNFELSFANLSARALLQIGNPASDREKDIIEDVFRPLIKKHQEQSESQKTKSKNQEFISAHESSIACADGHSFPGALRILSLLAADSSLIGYSIGVIDLSQDMLLSNALIQAQRTRSMCLLTAAHTFHKLTTNIDDILVSPLLRIEDEFKQLEAKIAVNAVITSLLEFLDLVINPDVSIKVNTKRDLILALRPPDLFRMLGHMILHAVEFAGLSGETTIDVSDHVPGEGVSITVISKSKRIIPFKIDNYLSTLAHRSATNTKQHFHQSDKITYGLSAAQQIADKYRTDIEINDSEQEILKLRVKVPLYMKREEEPEQ